jgi:hypothetical protein
LADDILQHPGEEMNIFFSWCNSNGNFRKTNLIFLTSLLQRHTEVAIDRYNIDFIFKGNSHPNSTARFTFVGSVKAISEYQSFYFPQDYLFTKAKKNTQIEYEYHTQQQKVFRGTNSR